MKLKYSFCLLIIALSSCNRESTLIVEPPPVIPKDYPATLKFTQERYNNYVATWIRFAQQYGKPLSPPAFDSVLMKPVHDAFTSIDLFPDRTDTVTIDDAEARLSTFIDDWKDLLGTTWAEVTVDSKQDDPSFKEYFFWIHKRFPYGTNVSLSFASRLTIHITHAGVISLLLDNCLPTLAIPAVVNIDSVRAKQTVCGKQLIYYDWGGRQTLTISNQTVKCAEIAAVAVPRWSDSLFTRRVAIEYRNSWRIRTWVFDVYVDAITGEDLNYAEQTVIF